MVYWLTKDMNNLFILMTKIWRDDFANQEIRTWGLWCSFQPLLHHTSSAHHCHIAPELISLLNCIRVWGKLVLMQYCAKIWC